MSIIAIQNNDGSYSFKGRSLNITKEKNIALEPFHKQVWNYGLVLHLLPNEQNVSDINRQIGNARFLANKYKDDRDNFYNENFNSIIKSSDESLLRYTQLFYGQIFNAVIYFHIFKRFVHRDLKFDNILISFSDPYPHIKIFIISPYIIIFFPSFSISFVETTSDTSNVLNFISLSLTLTVYVVFGVKSNKEKTLVDKPLNVTCPFKNTLYLSLQ